MIKKDYLLLWDFDGVIADSLIECLVTSYNAFATHTGQKKAFVWDRTDVPACFKKEFFKSRKYVRRAGEFFVIYKAVCEGRTLKDYASFERVLRAIGKELEEYERQFYKARDIFRNKRANTWAALHEVYPHIKKKWNSLEKFFKFYIVSNKDKNSIEIILKNAGFSLNPKDIYGKESGPDKAGIIEKILKKTHVSPKHVFFIDDNCLHFQDVRRLNIKLFFANWGYGDNEKKDFSDFVVLTPTNFDVKLRKACYGTIR